MAVGLMRLISAAPSPFARKVRIALLEKGLPHDVVVDNPWLAQTAVPQANPLGKVPALIADDGRVWHDSKVIVEYLETLAVPPPLLAADPVRRASQRQVEAVADGVCDAVVLIVQERARPEAMQSADWIARQRRKVDAGLGELQRRHAARDGFVAGDDGLGLAEVACGCALGYLDLRLPEADWRAMAPALRPLFDRLMTRPSFAATVPTAQPVPRLG